MSILSAGYPTRSYSSASLGMTTIARKTYTGHPSTGSRPDVFSSGQASSTRSTYTISRQGVGQSQAARPQQATMPYQASGFKRATLQDCLTCR